MNKDKYGYRMPLLTSKPYSLVNVQHKNKLAQLFCKHNYILLNRFDKTTVFENIQGDEIVSICPKCGKIEFTTFFEYEGMGYK